MSFAEISVAIAGIPRSGKTTMAEQLGGTLGLAILHTDELAKLGWSEASAAAAEWFDRPSVLIEGVAVGRALRKWLQANDGKPCERLIWLGDAKVKLLDGQATMASGCATIFLGIRDELEDRGVEIEVPGNVIEKWST